MKRLTSIARRLWIAVFAALLGSSLAVFTATPASADAGCVAGQICGSADVELSGYSVDPSTGDITVVRTVTYTICTRDGCKTYTFRVRVVIPREVM
jgi:hypothetical protein